MGGDAGKLRLFGNDRPAFFHGKMGLVTVIMLQTMVAITFGLCFSHLCMCASIYCAWWRTPVRV